MNNTTVEIVRHQLDDKLTRQVWTFWLAGVDVYLNRWAFETRQSTRHKWRTQRSYSRLRCAFPDQGGVRIREEVESPWDVVEEAYDIFRSRLNFKKWK